MLRLVLCKPESAALRTVHPQLTVPNRQLSGIAFCSQHKAPNFLSKAVQIMILVLFYLYRTIYYLAFLTLIFLPNGIHTTVLSNSLRSESVVLKTVFLFPSLMVPPMSPGLCSGISITTGWVVLGLNSEESASAQPRTFRAYSITATCNPRQTPGEDRGEGKFRLIGKEKHQEE